LVTYANEVRVGDELRWVGDSCRGLRPDWAVLSGDSSSRSHCPVEREFGLAILIPRKTSVDDEVSR
jgi:hypothetical protein